MMNPRPLGQNVRTLQHKNRQDASNKEYTLSATSPSEDVARHVVVEPLLAIDAINWDRS